ncbi:MAG: hypothetical protein WC657_01560 [Candidatus Paceibacterota bacterium]
MKWYFASRIRHREKLIDISEFLRNKGEIINSQWIYKESLKPYDQNISKVRSFSKEFIASLLDSDIFVLISDPEGTDMFIELGVCVAKNTLSNNIRIYIVGEHSKRSLMQLHPSIIHAHNLKEVFKLEKIEVTGFNIPSID